MKSRAPRRAQPTNSASAPPTPGPQGASQGLEAAREALLGAAVREPTVRLGSVSRLAPRFGLDGADVKVHAGGPVIDAALEVLGANAAAFQGELLFRDTQPPDELVAHELVHVAQTEQVGQAGEGTTSAPGDASEREADEQAQRVLEGDRAEVSQAATGAAQGSFFSSLQQSARELFSNTVSPVVNTVADALGIGDQEVAVGSAADETASATSAAIPAVFYANGMNTKLEEELEGGETHGASPDAAALEGVLGHDVQLNYNPTGGMVTDLAECGAEKFLGYNGAGVDNAAEEYLEAIKAGETVPIVAHSQGAIETSRAMEVVRNELAAEAMEGGLTAEAALAHAEAKINEHVEILLVGPGQAESAFASFVSDDNIASLTDPRDWVSEAATSTSRTDAAEGTADALITGAVAATSAETGWADPHAFSSYLETYPDTFEDWFEAVKNEHDPTKIDLIESTPRFA